MLTLLLLLALVSGSSNILAATSGTVLTADVNAAVWCNRQLPSDR
jgi:hypothetical protein